MGPPSLRRWLRVRKGGYEVEYRRSEIEGGGRYPEMRDGEWVNICISGGGGRGVSQPLIF